MRRWDSTKERIAASSRELQTDRRLPGRSMAAPMCACEGPHPS